MIKKLQLKALNFQNKFIRTLFIISATIIVDENLFPFPLSKNRWTTSLLGLLKVNRAYVTLIS